MQKINVSEMFPSDSLPDENMGLLVRKLEELVEKLNALNEKLKGNQKAKVTKKETEQIRAAYENAIKAGEPTFYNAGDLVSKIKEKARALRESLPSDAPGNLGAVLDAILDENGGFGNFSHRVLRGDMDNIALGKQGWISYNIVAGETGTLVSGKGGSKYGFRGDNQGAGTGAEVPPAGPGDAGATGGAGAGRPVAAGGGGQGAPVQAGEQLPVARGGVPERVGAGSAPDDGVGASDVPGADAGEVARLGRDEGASGQPAVPEHVAQDVKEIGELVRKRSDVVTNRAQYDVSSMTAEEIAARQRELFYKVYDLDQELNKFGEKITPENASQYKRALMETLGLSEAHADRLIGELTGRPDARRLVMSRRRREPEEIVDDVIDDISQPSAREMMDEAVG